MMSMFTTVLTRIGAEVSPSFNDQTFQVWDLGIKFRTSLISRQSAVSDVGLCDDFMKLGLKLEHKSE